MVVGTEFDSERVNTNEVFHDKERVSPPEENQKRKTVERSRLLGHALVLVSGRR